MIEKDEKWPADNNMKSTDELNSSENSSSFYYTPPKEKKPLPAIIISIILHPIFMGVYGIILLFLYTDFNIIFARQFFRFISPVLFLTCIIPASSIYFLKKAGLIKDYSLTEKNDRLIPYFLSFLSYALLVYYFNSAGLYMWFISTLVAPMILIAVTAIINIFWKISAHMIGIGGLIGCTLSVCYNVKGINPFILFIILFILAGCLGVARLVLKKHTPAQVYIGFLVGITISYFCVKIGAYWGFISFMKNI